jgi:hypothetical protein
MKEAVKLRSKCPYTIWDGNMDSLVRWFDESNRVLKPISNYFYIEDGCLYYVGLEDSLTKIQEGKYIVKDSETYNILSVDEFESMFYALN